MPYQLVKQGDKWVVKNMDTGKRKGTHDSKPKAQRQLNLLRGVKHGGWKPTGAPARK